MTAAIVGIFAIAFAPILPSYSLLLAMLGLASIFQLHSRSSRSRVILAFVLAFCYAGLYGHWRVALLLPAHLSGSDFVANIKVLNIPEERLGFSRYYRFDAMLTELSCKEDIQDSYCDSSQPLLDRRRVQLNW